MLFKFIPITQQSYRFFHSSSRATIAAIVSGKSLYHWQVDKQINVEPVSTHIFPQNQNNLKIYFNFYFFEIKLWVGRNGLISNDNFKYYAYSSIRSLRNCIWLDCLTITIGDRRKSFVVSYDDESKRLLFNFYENSFPS